MAVVFSKIDGLAIATLSKITGSTRTSLSKIIGQDNTAAGGVAELRSTPVSSDYTNDAQAAETIVLTWLTGDVIVVVGVQEDSQYTFSTPTAAGGVLTFSEIAKLTASGDCTTYAWKATAAGNGTAVTITAAQTGTAAIHGSGITGFVFKTSAGIGTPVTSAGRDGTTSITSSLTRVSSGSCVVMVMGDWSAVNDTGAAATPSSGGTLHIRGYVVDKYTPYVLSWTNQGETGTTSYGVSGLTAGNTFDMNSIVFEVKGP